MTPLIHLGFEIGTGKEISIQASHIIVSGLTQLSGKTTTLEALIRRSDATAIVFKTKPGETGFGSGRLVAPYFKEKSDWQYVQSLLEATMKERMKFERSWIIEVCKGTNSLQQVKKNIDEQLALPKLNGLSRSVYTTLQAYLALILPELALRPLSNIWEVGPGVNIMDLEQCSEQLQSLVIRSVLETVLRTLRATIVVIPEAWKFLPQGTGNPCKRLAEEFIRQGATNRNFLWIDSQDMSGVDKTPLKSVATWILGLQTERNEVQHTLDQMPIPKRLKPKEEDIMTLQRGHFFVCTPTFTAKVYVQPAWMDDPSLARDIAKGIKSVEEVQKPVSAALPPLPSMPIHSLPAAIPEEMQRALAILRADFMKQIEQLTAYLKKVSELVGQFATAQPAATIDPDDLVTRVLQKLPNLDLQRQSIIDEVLAKIPRIQMSGSPVLSVEPLQALQKQFLEETKDRIVKEIGGLSPEQKKVIKFVESAQRGVNQKDLLERCLGQSGTSGGNQGKIKGLTKDLAEKGLVRRDDRIATTYPNLKERVKSALGFHDANEEEILSVYNHIISELL